MSDSLLHRIAALVEIAERRSTPRLGKTAMQKLLYLLQEGLDVPLGYHFELYTYGPYESLIMHDIDYGSATNVLDVTYEPDAGFSIRPGPVAAEVRSYREALKRQYGQQLNDLISKFGRLSARELELRATVLYVWKDDPNLDDNHVIELVNELKPRFERTDIALALAELRDSGLYGRETSSRGSRSAI